ncbi:MAG: hypothetical protein AAF721_13955 [Myxococcota bacterium]
MDWMVVGWAVVLGACVVEPDAGDTEAGGSETEGATEGATASVTDAETDARTDSATATVGGTESIGGSTDDGTSAGSSGDPIDTDAAPGASVEPKACGWDGEGYGCGWAPDGAECGAGVVAGGACEDLTATCCSADGDLVRCACLGNACEPMWVEIDCEFGEGAGTCGYHAAAAEFACGGEDAAPGLATGCGRAVADNADCKSDAGETCCDAEGDHWRCEASGNGGFSWQRTDCVLG